MADRAAVGKLGAEDGGVDTVVTFFVEDVGELGPTLADAAVFQEQIAGTELAGAIDGEAGKHGRDGFHRVIAEGFAGMAGGFAAEAVEVRQMLGVEDRLVELVKNNPDGARRIAVYGDERRGRLIAIGGRRRETLESPEVVGDLDGQKRREQDRN